MQKKLKERLDVFSDAIIAIIITVMVLELPIKFIKGQVDIFSLMISIGIYAVSFCFVANLWYQHSVIFNEVDEVQTKIVIFDLVFIFFLSLIPTFTRLMTNDTNSVTVVMYGILSLIISVIFRLITRSIVHTKYTNKADMEKLYQIIYGNGYYQSWGAYLLLIVIGWFFPIFSLILFIILPITSFVLHARDDDTFNEINNSTSGVQSTFLRMDHNQRKIFQSLIRRYIIQQRKFGSNPDKQKAAWQEFASEAKKQFNISDESLSKWYENINRRKTRPQRSSGNSSGITKEIK